MPGHEDPKGHIEADKDGNLFVKIDRDGQAKKEEENFDLDGDGDVDADDRKKAARFLGSKKGKK